MPREGATTRMTDFLAAFGLLLAFEGIFFAAFPGFARRILSEAAEAPVERMRIVGIVCAIVGLAFMWTARQAGVF